MASSDPLSGKTGFPTLQPAYIIKVDVGEGHSVGTVSTGSSFAHYNTSVGTISTVAGFEPKLEAKVVFGGDSLYFDPDKERGRVNVRGIAKTETGTSLSFAYSGVIKVNSEIEAIFQGSPEAHTIPFGQATTGCSFQVGDPKYKDLENSTWVGNGRFVVEGGKLTAESRISKVIASRDMN